ncbi:g8046 [Coccomyxa viridis]|uniref:G8046 protein n=1 Tax=Coccomyxa viridis TaxID=1274662 RepID=A0ABP1G1W9_9CHLO
MPKGQKRKSQDDDGDEDYSKRAAPKAAGKRKAKAGKPTVEKRINAAGGTSRYSATPSQHVKDRIARALPVYRVKVGKFPQCNCPDFKIRKNLCKHYLYVMIRVLRLREDDPLVWQRALLLSEAEEVFSGKHSTRTEEEVITNAALQQAWRRLQGDSSAGAAEPTEASKPIEGDCAICYDEMHPDGGTLQTRVVACGTCKNYVHESCFAEWKKQKKTLHQDVTCVYCRNPWQDSSASGVLDGEYMNLKHLSAEHRNADTSPAALYGASAQWIGFHDRRRS